MTIFRRLFFCSKEILGLHALKIFSPLQSTAKLGNDLENKTK